jgi:predicted Zn-dependent protease
MLVTTPAFATTFIRDAETEAVLRNIADPIFRAADITPENVHLYLIQSNDLNAFVAEGMNIFIHTSLLLYSDKPDTLIGVLAHETGHITGGHLIKKGDGITSLTATTALGYILGAATAIAGAPAAGQAIATGTQHVSERLFLKFNRTQEQTADQAALNILNKLGYSPEGLVTLLETLRQQTSARYGNIDPYAITHPLSNERITHIRSYMQQSPPTRSLPETLQHRYKKVVAKVSAFLNPPSMTLGTYPVSDTSENARYARSIAYFKQPNLTKALTEIDTLITDYPGNPYYHEMRGQMLFENGRLVDAIESYKQAERLLPDNALIKIQLASVMIAREDTALLDEATILLQQGLNIERDNSAAWQQLGIAYGRKGDLGMSYLSLTERAVLTREMTDAKQYAEFAKQHLPADSPAMQRLIDLNRIIEEKK